MDKPQISPEDLDHTPLTFGKYKGKTCSEIAKFDPQYIVWMYNNVTEFNTCSKVLADDCEKDLPRPYTGLRKDKPAIVAQKHPKYKRTGFDTVKFEDGDEIPF